MTANLWNDYHCEYQKHIMNMILFTGFDISDVGIKNAVTSSFYFFLTFLLFFKTLSTLELIPLSMENLQDFITQVII